jgi:hypothetical protein
VDSTSPTFVISASPDPAKVGSVTITVVANEKLSELDVEVKQNGQTSSTDVPMSSLDKIIWTGVYSVVSGYDGRADIFASGKDLVGRKGTGTGSFVADTIPPTINTPTDAGKWSSSSIITWSWPASIDSLSGLVGYYMCIGTTPGGNEVLNDQWIGDVTSYTYPSGVDGKTYYAKIKAKDKAGNISSYSESSDGITVDTTPPKVSIDYPESDKWYGEPITNYYGRVSDSISGIDLDTLEYNYNNMGWTPFADDGGVHDWDDSDEIPHLTDTVGTPLQIRVKDKAGNIGTSALITIKVDSITLPVQNLKSMTHPDSNVWYSNNDPQFSWDTPQDASGIEGYSYVIDQIQDTSPDEVVDTKDNSVSFQDKQDGVWYFHIRARDKADPPHWSEPVHYKIQIDTTPPTGAPSIPTDTGAYSNSTTITFSWTQGTVQDSLSGIAGYYLQVGTTPGGNDKFDGYVGNVLSKGIPDCEEGKTYYARVRAKNGAGLYGKYSDNSDGIKIDLTPPTASISISPSSPVKTGLLSITLTASEELLEAPTLKYTPQGGSSIQISLTGSGKVWTGSTYINSTTPDGTAVFTFSGKDLARNVGTQITDGGLFEIDKTIYVSQGGEVSNEDGSKVEVPPNVLPTNVNIMITKVPLPTFDAIAAYDFTATEDGTDKPIPNFNGFLTITIPYPEGPREEERLRIFRLGEDGPIQTSKVYPSLNVITAKIDHFSIFFVAPYAHDLDSIFAYPNPCRPLEGQEVKIVNIPAESDVTIRIYNIAGQLIRTLKEGEEIQKGAGSKVAIWDCRDVASGIYIYIIETAKGKKIGKIGVIK